MICQPVLRKANRQLLSLFLSPEKRRLCQFPSVTQSLRQKYHKLLSRKRFYGSLLPQQAVCKSSSADSCNTHADDATFKHEQSFGNTDASGEESSENVRHVPVMVNEVLSFLEPNDNQVFVDMTFGAGGHARQILQTSPAIRYIGADRDPTAYGLAQVFAANYRDGQVTPLLSKFSELPSHLEGIGVHPGTVDCFLMDLGASSMQFDSASRGFALSQDGPLDMRMDGQRFLDTPTAADVVNNLEPHELSRILKKYGEERNARAIAHAIVEARYAFGNFTRTRQLADVVKAVFDSNFRHDKLHRHAHVATKTFQALRIFVNDELNEIYNGLEVAHHYLKPGGRCAVISFHSLEDRIVKRHFHGIDMDLESNISIHSYLRNSRISFDNEEVREKYLSHQWHPMQRKVLEPSVSEINRNPRSRSAKFRAAVKATED